MEKVAGLEEFEKEMWPLKNKFLTLIEPYRSDLWKYCRSLTGSPWDAEDLVQETLLKAFASLGQVSQWMKPKSYLFRIATNTWINQRRRANRFTFSVYEDEMRIEESTESTPFNVQEAMETLISYLTPRQAVVVLLVEVFHFTGAETAEMIATTEGAVKAALHRARAKLKLLAENGAHGGDPSMTKEPQEQHISNPQLINAMIDAFHQRDPDAMAALFHENAYNDIVHVGQEYGRATMRKWSINDTFKYWTSRIEACYEMLWGRPVILVFIETEAGMNLNSIIYLETEDDSIVLKKEYYFCKDLLSEAARELGIPVHDRGITGP
jgi:RNA polymerase sigma factor (sigma-70 family)